MEEFPEARVEELIVRMREKCAEIRRELSRRIYGQEELVEQLLVSILGRGHCLLIGVPGLAKTLLVSTLAEVAELDFKRVQFTPDMMPSDITGSEVLEENHSTGTRDYKFVKGPVFTQLLLADEINRTPPKTQAALLEAMQERQVSIAGKSFALDSPFFVLATQNPIEQEGTYPLPEAQLDRFMFCLKADYPSEADEMRILRETTMDGREELRRVVNGAELIEFQRAVRFIPVPDSGASFAVRLVRGTRPNGDNPISGVDKYLRWGAGPRACQYLAVAGKVFAALDGRFNVSREDIVRAAHPVLRHRVILNYRAEADGVTVEDVIDGIVELLK